MSHTDPGPGADGVRTARVTPTPGGADRARSRRVHREQLRTRTWMGGLVRSALSDQDEIKSGSNTTGPGAPARTLRSGNPKPGPRVRAGDHG